MQKVLRKIWPFIAILTFVSVFFWKVFILGLAPIPGDFIVGTYFPWLDYKWGYSVGVPVKNPITSDVVSIIYPLRSYAVDILKTGHLPLWNPLMFGGTPLFADFQVGVLSPTIIFYFLLPKIWAWTTQVMLQPFLAATFMYLLLRNFGLKKIESIFGGIFYAFSAFNMIWMEWNNSTLVAAIIPLVILLTDKFIRSNRLVWGALLSLAICIQVFAGYPQLVVYSVITLLIFAVFFKKGLTRNKIMFLMSFLLLGFLLSSVLLIPAVEFVLNSQRTGEVLAKDLIFLPWQNLLTFLAPDYFGNPATINYSGIGNYTLNAGYSGIIVLILSIVGVVNNWRKVEIKFFLTLFILSLFFSLPTPFAKLIFYSHIPALSASSMTRILVLANLSLAAIAAYGISGLIGKERLGKVFLVFVPIVTLAAVLIYTFYFGIDRTVALRNLVLPILFAGTGAVAIFVGTRLRKVFKLLAILAVCMVGVFELFIYGWKYTPFSSPKLVFPETPVLSFLKNDNSIYRVSPGDVIPMNMWVPYNLESVSGYDALYPVWYAKFTNIVSGGDPKKTDFGYYAPFYLYNSSWFDVLNNKYLLVNVNENLFGEIKNDAKFEKLFEDKSVAIFRNNKVLPRAFVVSDRAIRSGSDSLEIPVALPEGEASYDFYSPERSVINTKSPADGFLFVSENWYPGWTAKVDGKSIPVNRVDYAFRAVPISRGVHKVEFIYKPKTLEVGELVSIGSLVIILGMFFYDSKAHEKVHFK